MATKLLNASKAWGKTSVIVWLWRSNPRIEDDSFIKSGHLYWKSKGMESMVCSWQETMSLFNSHGQSIFDDKTTIGSEVQNAKMKKKLCNSILLLIPMTTSEVTSKISAFLTMFAKHFSKSFWINETLDKNIEATCLFIWTLFFDFLLRCRFEEGWHMYNTLARFRRNIWTFMLILNDIQKRILIL